MAAFLQDFTIQQSDDCTTLTLADNSNFSSNDQDYTYSTFTTKNISIYDSLNNLIISLPIVDSTPVTYTLTTDMYLSIVYTLQINTDTPLIKTKNVALSCFVDLQYGNIVTLDTLNEDGNNPNLFKIIKGIKAAKIFALRSNGTLAQDCLNYANSYANDITNAILVNNVNKYK